MGAGMILTGENVREAILTLWGIGHLKEAADAIGCSERTVRRWVKEMHEPQARYAGAIRRAVKDRANDLLREITRFAA
jgi:hypothetical protein